jgi:hypothetical protein
VSYEDLDTKPLLEQPPLPGHRIMRIVKCDDK